MRNSLKSTTILGFFGAGQLARMSALQAFRFGIQIATYSDRPEHEPVHFMSPFSSYGSFEDVDAMIEFAKSCNIITLENEFINSSVLKEVQEKSGTPIFPSPESFEMIENKLIEKQTFQNAGIPVTPYKLVKDSIDLKDFGTAHGWPFLLKSSKGGYDGYGNKTVNNYTETIKAFEKLGGLDGHEILAEAFVDFTHELAVQVARNETGSVVYPCCETVQENHICVAVLAPASVDVSIQEKAQSLAIKATEAINGKGIYAFEFFLTTSGDVILNESAPRPHNSGHYTIEGCIGSQFENHIRAVLGLPLASTSMTEKAAAMINLLGTHNREATPDRISKSLSTSDGHLHIYGKVQSKIGRKMGHFTLLGDDLNTIYEKAKKGTKGLEI